MMPRRAAALIGLALSLALLIPGLIAPVITIRGQLEPSGVAALAPQLLKQGISDQTIAAITPLMNPMVVAMLGSPAAVKQQIIDTLSTELTRGLATGQPIEVYQQTRSILGSVRHLYTVGSPLPATLILIFSVLVPFLKATLVLWGVMQASPERRRKTLGFVELIAKWSMADVFAVALFIAYLAARASQTPPGPGFAKPIVTFDATFGAGFYWFAGYCVFSLAVQQATARWLMRSPASDVRR
jgi:hypothetical protein